MKVEPKEMIGHGDQDIEKAEILGSTHLKTRSIILPKLCGLRNEGNEIFPKEASRDLEKQTEIISEIWNEGLMTYGVPAGLAAITGTFLMRYRYRLMKSTIVENFILHTLQYYGATSLGVAIGLALFKPTFERRILERIPHSDLAREIRRVQSKRQE